MRQPAEWRAKRTSSRGPRQGCTSPRRSSLPGGWAPGIPWPPLRSTSASGTSSVTCTRRDSHADHRRLWVWFQPTPRVPPPLRGGIVSGEVYDGNGAPFYPSQPHSTGGQQWLHQILSSPHPMPLSSGSSPPHSVPWTSSPSTSVTVSATTGRSRIEVRPQVSNWPSAPAPPSATPGSGWSNRLRRASSPARTRTRTRPIGAFGYRTAMRRSSSIRTA